MNEFQEFMKADEGRPYWRAVGPGLNPSFSGSGILRAKIVFLLFSIDSVNNSGTYLYKKHIFPSFFENAKLIKN